MQPNSRANRAPRISDPAPFPASLTASEPTTPARDCARPKGGAPGVGPGAAATGSGEAAAVTALWCPHCKTPFVGAVDPRDASFVHQRCGGRSVLDMDLLDALAADSWFWRRYRDRLHGQG